MAEKNLSVPFENRAGLTTHIACVYPGSFPDKKSTTATTATSFDFTTLTEAANKPRYLYHSLLQPLNKVNSLWIRQVASLPRP